MVHIMLNMKFKDPITTVLIYLQVKDGSFRDPKSDLDLTFDRIFQVMSMITYISLNIDFRA